MQSTCNYCQGTGSIVDDPCVTCAGSGQVEVERAVRVTFPEGIGHGQTLRVPGQGLKSSSGGPAGHLYVEVEVAEHERFQRDGDDLIAPLTISYPQATLGHYLEIETLEDDLIKVKIPSGTQPGDTIVLRNEGIPHLGRGGRGDLIIVIQVRIPKRISGKAKKLIKELDGLLD